MILYVAALVTIFLTHLVMFYLALDLDFSSFPYGSQNFSQKRETNQKQWTDSR